MDQPDPTPPARGTRTALKVALVSAGVVAGAIGATAIGASATTAGTGSASSSTSAASSAASGAPNGAPNGLGAPGPGAPGSGAQGPGAHGPGGGQNPAETVLTDTAMKAKLTAAAKVAVPGATVDKVETDSGDAKYEVHMTKTDGSRVTVKFDANLKQTAVEDGMGK